jgi:hypothetical protein
VQMPARSPLPGGLNFENDLLASCQEVDGPWDMTRRSVTITPML